MPFSCEIAVFPHKYIPPDLPLRPMLCQSRHAGLTPLISCIVDCSAPSRPSLITGLCAHPFLPRYLVVGTLGIGQRRGPRPPRQVECHKVEVLLYISALFTLHGSIAQCSTKHSMKSLSTCQVFRVHVCLRSLKAERLKKAHRFWAGYGSHCDYSWGPHTSTSSAPTLRLRTDVRSISP